MVDELPFRASMVILAIAFQAARWPTRYLTGGKATWRAMKKNPRDGIVLSTCTVLWVTSIVLYAGLHPWLKQWQVEIPDLVRWVGISSGLAAVALTRWADIALGNNLSIVVQMKADQTLVTIGPYRWIRHPIYAATILFASMLVITSANFLVAVCAVAAASLMLGTRVPAEERLLIDRFGDQYRTYMRHTGRFLPRLFPPSGRDHLHGPHFLRHKTARAQRSSRGTTTDAKP
jgi:protein-S-isoprenylcysteine O-methyltransferase Ste14